MTEITSHEYAVGNAACIVSYRTITQAVKDGNNIILDCRGIGMGKTTEANELSKNLSQRGIVVFRVMYDYESCKEHSCDCEGSFVYRGKPQKGMCPYYDKISLNKNEIGQVIFCGYCKNDSKSEYYDNCSVRKQDKEVKNYNIIFTHHTNLRALKRLFKKRRIVTIIDDCELVPIIYHSKEYPGERVEYLESILDYRIATPIDPQDLRKVRWAISSAYYNKINKMDEYHNEFAFYDLNDLNDLLNITDYYLANCSKKEIVKKCANNPELNEKPSILYEWRHDIFGEMSVIYQSSTPAHHDVKILGSLTSTPITIVKGNPEPNDNWSIIGITRGLYSKTSSIDSIRFQSIWHKMMAVCDFIARETFVKTVEISSNELYRTILNPSEGLYHNVKHIDHYGKGIKGTNTLSSYKYGIIGGVLFIPPFFVDRSPYIEETISHHPQHENLNVVQWERAQANIIQAAGRLFRNSNNTCRDLKKVVFVMSSIDLHEKDGYNIETGAKIDRMNNIDDLYNSFRKEISDDLKMAVINHVVRKGEGHLDKIAKSVSNELKNVYSHEWVKKEIEKSDKFKIEMNSPKGRGRPAKYFVTMSP